MPSSRTAFVAVVLLLAASKLWGGVGDGTTSPVADRTDAKLAGRARAPAVNDNTFSAVAERFNLGSVLRRVAVNNTVVVTTASKDFERILRNWICHIKLLRMQNVVVFSLDERTHRLVESLGVASHWDREADLGGVAVGVWNSNSYNSVVYAKTSHQLAVLGLGYNMLFTDVDIPWTHNWQSAVVEATSDLDFAAQLNHPFGDLNVGFFYARSTPATIGLFRQLQQLEAGCSNGTVKFPADDGKPPFPLDDQTLFMFLLYCGLPTGALPAAVGTDVGDMYQYVLKSNRKHKVHRANWMTPMVRPHRAMCVESGVDVRYGTFAPAWFQTGHKTFKQKHLSSMITKNRTVLYHGNFLKGEAAKIEQFKTYGRWIESC